MGDFLWAANEPSGGTFQVKMNLLLSVEPGSKISEMLFIFVFQIFNGCTPELSDAGGQLALHGSRLLLLAKVRINIVDECYG